MQVDAEFVRTLIAHGREDALLEWKGKLNTSDRREQAEFIKDMLALVNAHGTGKRYLLVGVRNDGTVVGVSEMTDDAHLQQIVTQRVEPPIEFATSCVEFDGLRVGVLEVERSLKRFHVVSKEFKDNDDILLRKGDTWIKTGSSRNPPTAWDFQRLRDEIAESSAPQPKVLVTFRGETEEVSIAAKWEEPPPLTPDNFRFVAHPILVARESKPLPAGLVRVEFEVNNTGTLGADSISVFIRPAEGCRVFERPINYGATAMLPSVRRSNAIWVDVEQNVIGIRVDHLTHGLHIGELIAEIVVPKPDSYDLVWKAHASNMVEETHGTLTIHVA